MISQTSEYALRAMSRLAGPGSPPASSRAGGGRAGQADTAGVRHLQAGAGTGEGVVGPQAARRDSHSIGHRDRQCVRVFRDGGSGDAAAQHDAAGRHRQGRSDRDAAAGECQRAARRQRQRRTGLDALGQLDLLGAEAEALARMFRTSPHSTPFTSWTCDALAAAAHRLKDRPRQRCARIGKPLLR